MKSFVNLLLFLLMMITMYTLPWEFKSIGVVHVISGISLFYSLIINIIGISDAFSLNEEELVARFTSFILLINSILIIYWIPNWEYPTLFGIFAVVTLLYSLVRVIIETTADDIHI